MSLPAPAPSSIAVAGVDPQPSGLLIFAYQWRGSLAAVPIVLAALIPERPDLAPHHAWIPGAALVLVGWLLRIWAQRHVRYRLRARKTFVSCGPYAWVRNPIYLANTAMIAGTVLACGTPWLALFSVAWCGGLYAAVVRYEEAKLTQRYGDPYVDYLGDTSRWVPSRRGGTSFGTGACPHDRVGAAIIVELHTPLILLPALLKWWM